VLNLLGSSEKGHLAGGRWALLESWLRHAWRWIVYTGQSLPPLAVKLKTFLAVLLFSYLFAMEIAPEPVLRARAAGVFLQIAGILSVAKGLKRHRTIFRRKGFRETFLDWVQHGPKFNPTPISLHGSPSLGPLTLSARGSFWMASASGASIEERLSVLDANLTTLKRRVEEMQEALQKETESRYQADQREAEERGKADRKTREDLESFAVGGLSLEANGVTWLLIGTFLGGLPEASVFLFTTRALL
jgi:hypothetical protein